MSKTQKNIILRTALWEDYLFFCWEPYILSWRKKFSLKFYLLTIFLPKYLSNILYYYRNTLPPAPAPAAPAGGNEQWALAPAPVQNNQWAVSPATPVGGAPPADAWAQPPADAWAQPPPAFAAAPATPAYSAAPPNLFSPPPAQQQQQQQPNFASQPGPFVGGQQQPPAFASPQPSVGMTASQQNVFSPAPPASAPLSLPPVTSNGSFGAHGQPAPVAPNQSLTMNKLSSNGGLLGNSAVSADNGSMADKALQNLMGSIDSFGITGSAAKPANPFDTNDSANNKTLGERKSSSPKKPVMNSVPGAMVMANNQSGNWGMGMQQQQPSQYGGMGMGMQQQQQQQQQYGGYPQQQQQQPMMGSYNMGVQGGGMQQPPPMQGGMQQQPPPMQGGMPPQYGQQQPPQWGTGGPTY